MSAGAVKDHPLKPTSIEQMSAVVQDNPVPPQWPSFGKFQLVGTSPSGRVTVFVDLTLGQPGKQNALDLLQDADRIVNTNDTLFGSVGDSVSVIIFALHGRTDGRGGADHLGCDYKTGAAIEVCASFGNSMRVSALFEAELSECSMGGNLCGVSTGEALSRWCAAVIGSNALSDFATAPRWARDGMPDFVNRTDPTDGNPDSTGCGMAFLSWLMSQGHGLDQIAQEMVRLGESGTLAQLYGKLTSDSITNAWPAFRAAIQALSGSVTSDDPFGAFQPRKLDQTLSSVTLGSNILAAVLADVAAGKEAHQIVPGVQAILATISTSNTARGAACCRKSRRLLPPD